MIRLHPLPSVLLLGVFLIPALSPVRAADLPAPGERRVGFDQGWRFQKADLSGAERLDFDDAAWRTLDLPHDWAIEGPFDPAVSPHQGSLPYFGVAWYRKSFEVPESARGRFYSIEFDGVMSNARVFLNGVELGGRPYGYIGFSFELTPHLRFGAENVLAVRVAPEDQSSRWYPGAGIYRHVWLEVTGAVHVARWGTYVTTPSVTEAAATVSIRTDVRNRESRPVRGSARHPVLDSDGAVAGRSEVAWTVGARLTVQVPTQIVVTKPRRWDLGSPHLYRAVTTVKVGDGIADRFETPFGIRSLEWSRETGFLLNGRPVRFQGVCNHHDLGALGAAVNRRATERQLEILKGMGTNAIRTSHNPPSPELLEAADRMGFLVMDEAFDMWGRPKTAQRSREVLRRMGRAGPSRHDPARPQPPEHRDVEHRQRDPRAGRARGADVARRLTAICHEEDATGPSQRASTRSTTRFETS